jgi:hypothetical protein
MAAQLDFYNYDETTKISTALDGTYSLGDIFKGASGIGALRIYNSGTKTAVNPIVSFASCFSSVKIQIGKDYLLVKIMTMIKLFLLKTLRQENLQLVKIFMSRISMLMITNLHSQ